MQIDINRDGSKIRLIPVGKIDSNTAGELERIIEDNIDGITELVLDMASVNYVSSAGLRVLLGAEQIMEERGSFTVMHVCEDVMDVLHTTGFDGVLNIVE